VQIDDARVPRGFRPDRKRKSTDQGARLIGVPATSTFFRLILSPLLSALQRAARSVEEPLGLVRLVVGAMALLGTLIALILGVTTEPRALQLVGALWAVYGLIVGITSGVLEPVIDGLFNVLSNVGLMRAGGGYSSIETLVARGHFTTAADAYAERARNPRERVEATLRRAKLLAHSLGSAETAALELENLRMVAQLSSRDDFRVGLALVELYERHLADPGKAMAELRRLIDRHASAREVRRLRTALAELKSKRFESPLQS
jgi:hypothetical protein